MKAVKLANAQGKTPPHHFDMRTFPLFEKSPDCNLALSVSHYLPGGGADFGPQPVEVIFYVISGEIVIDGDNSSITLSAGEAIHINEGENKSVKNKSNMPTSMLVIANLSTLPDCSGAKNH